MHKSLQSVPASNRKTKRLRIDSDKDEEEHNYEGRLSPELGQSRKKSARQSSIQPIRLKKPRLDSRNSATDTIASTTSAKTFMNGKRSREKDREREDQNDYQDDYQTESEEHGREHTSGGHGRQRGTSRSRSRSQSRSQSPVVRSSSSLTPIPTSLLGPSSSTAPQFGSSPLSEPDEPPSTAAAEDHSPRPRQRRLSLKAKHMAGEKDNLSNASAPNTTVMGAGDTKKKKVQKTNSRVSPVPAKRNKKRTRQVYSDDDEDGSVKEDDDYGAEEGDTEEEEEGGKLSDEYDDDDDDDDIEKGRLTKGTTKGRGKSGKGLTAGVKAGKSVGKGANKEKEKEKDRNVTAILKRAKFEGGSSLDNKDSTTTKSAKRSFAETTRKKSHVEPEDSSTVDVTGDSGAPSMSPAMHNVEPNDKDRDKDEPGHGAPPAKKRKLPTIKKLRNAPISSASGAAAATTGTGSTNTPTTTKPTGNVAGPTADSSNTDMNKLGIPEIKPNVRPKTVATADLDLMNASVYAELFKIPGGAAMRANSNRRLKEEERRKELDKLRNEYKAKLAEEAKASFDLQRPAEKIARFEEQLRSWRSTALYPNFLAAKWREIWEREKKNAEKWEKTRQPEQQQRPVTSHDHAQNGIKEDGVGIQDEGKEEGEM